MAETRDQTDEQDRSSRERSKSEGERSEDERPKSVVPSVQVIGWAVVLLILGGYFAWMIIEMGAHAVTKAYPMLGLLVAAIVGGVAATLGLMIGRRSGD